MGKACAVSGCKTSRGLSCHAFPSDKEMRKKWVDAIRNTTLQDADETTFKTIGVCFEHFTDDLVLPGKIRKLKPGSVPTENLPEERVSQIKKRNRENLLQNKKKGDLSPFERKLYDEAFLCRKALSNRILYERNRAKRRKKQAERKKALKEIENVPKNLTDAQRNFIEIITKNLGRTPHGRRFNLQQKILALTLYKLMGTRGYETFRCLFLLPSIKTLTNLLQRIPITPGINDFTIDHLKATAESLYPDDKVCVVMWDEMAIQPLVEVIEKVGVILGHEDWGTHTTDEAADDVLVFYLRGLKSGWKSPVSFSFCKGQTTADQLAISIKDHIDQIAACGFNPIATVCDQGSSNERAIKHLIEESKVSRQHKSLPERDLIQVGEREIIPLFDTPHLLKGFRNNLLDKFLEFNYSPNTAVERKFAKWDVIVAAYMADKHSGEERVLNKLTDDHINPEGMKKMKVKIAAQVCSNTVAAFIKAFSFSNGQIETPAGTFEFTRQEALTTSRALKFANDVFDSCNAGPDDKGNYLRRPVTAGTTHVQFWKEAIGTLNHMCYVKPSTNNPSNNVSTLKNWKFTLEGFLKIWERLQELGFTSLNTRYLNQDPLENFFGCIRQQCPTNPSPTPRQFISSFKTLVINDFAIEKSVGTNCEKDIGGPLIFVLQKYLIKPSESTVRSLNDKSYQRTSKINASGVIHQSELVKSLIFDRTLEKLEQCECCKESFSSEKCVVSVTTASRILLKFLNIVWHVHELDKVLLRHLKQHFDLSWHFCEVHNDDVFQILGFQIVENIKILWVQRRNILSKRKGERGLQEDTEYVKVYLENMRRRCNGDKVHRILKRSVTNSSISKNKMKFR